MLNTLNKILFLLVFVSTFVSLTLIANQESLLNLTDSEIKFIKKHPKIVLGIKERWNISGYNNDLLNLINELSGANFKLKAVDYSVIQELSKKGEIDGLVTCEAMEDKKKYLNFSDVYISMQKMIITTKENPKDIDSIKDLDTKMIAVYKNNLVDVKIANKFKSSIIIKYDTIEDVIKAVATNQADVMFGSNLVYYLAHELGYTNLKNVANLDEKLDFVFGVRKDWQEAISIINKSLEYIGKDKLIHLKNKWFFSQKRFENYVLSDNDLKYIKSLKSLKICVDPNSMPIEAIIDSRHVGIASDYWKLFEEKLGVDVKIFKTKSWSGSLEAMQQKKCDILSLSSPIKELKQQIKFTDSFLELSLVMITLADKKSIIDFRTLDGASVAVVKGHFLSNYISNKYPNINLIKVRDIDEGLKKVEDGEVFGCADSSVAIDYAYHNGTYSNFKISAYFDDKLELGLGVAKNNIRLYNILQKVVNNISDEQEQTILEKYFSTKYEKQFDYSMFWKLIIIVLIIVLVIIFRQYNIQKQNKKLIKRVQDELEKSRDKDKMIFHQSKLAAMGEMIENITHQWRQPLSQVNSAVLIIDDTLEEKGIKNEVIEEKLLEIESLTKYMSNTINDFKNFFDENKIKYDFIIEDILDKAIEVLDTKLKSNDIKISLGIKTEHKCFAYPNELQQVFLIILNNAIDAIQTNNKKSSKIKIEVEKIDNYNYIRICDNAGGMSKEIEDKIFEPYYTTKHKTQGTGLGLYIAKIIIEDSLGGELSLQNKSTGVCFIIKLKVEDGQ
ncbi:MAG: transporter substrate-binding domain-containing protein [Sulfurimonas sp.]|nr:transporter substrate-binding domain-containing protein [Sulfurimonas sp.]